MVFLPTRRAKRSLIEALLRRSEGRPLLLPRIRPLGDVMEEDLIFEGGLGGEGLIGADEAALIPPAIAPLERQIVLTRLVHAWLQTRHDWPAEGSVGAAARLASALGHFLDQSHIEGARLENLPGLVPAEFAAHWQMVLGFLDIITQRWPEHLDEQGKIDRADRRNRMIWALARRWQMAPPDHPVIAAGSTGSVPASAELMAVISGLPDGAVILPGLDQAMDEESWEALAESHPQFGLKQLLRRLVRPREAVALWPYGEDEAAPRRALLTEAMRPAETAQRWRDAAATLKATLTPALQGLSTLSAPEPGAEARAIALVLREALEQPGRTAMLVTPDRALARQVAREMERWDVRLDDSAGVPLHRSEPAIFFDLIARAAAERFAPVPLLALLKHDLCRLGADPESRAAFLARLDRGLRGVRPAPGLEGLGAHLLAQDQKARADDPKWADDPIVPRLLAAFEAYEALPAQGDAASRLTAQIGCAEALAQSHDRDGAARLWAGDEGEALAEFLRELLDSAALIESVGAEDWPDLLAALMTGRAVRPQRPSHPRLHILGPLEARLQRADLIVLGGLNEGVWPRTVTADPWMSRPMRRDFGLEAPERQIGLAAHDFTQMAANPDIVLTRSLKRDGAPAAPSRWWTRTETLIRAAGGDPATLDRRDLAALAVNLDDADTVTPARNPAPRPPVEARPRKLSVTEIETLLRDPYAIYAKHVLKLKPLDPLDADPGAAERGTWIHDALEDFTREYPGTLPAPDQAVRALLAIGGAIFDSGQDSPVVRNFWWPRFERMAAWFVETEQARRAGVTAIRPEVEGEIGFTAPGGGFVLRARADRVDERADGTLALYDYKTGQPPSNSQIESGLSPQLTLQAAMLERGGFEGIAPARVSALAHIKLTGRDEGGKDIPVPPDQIAAWAERAWENLQTLIAAFDNPDKPYPSQPRPQFRRRTGGDYDHLARFKEWAEGEEAPE